MPFPTTLKQLCTPAYVYFAVSVLVLLYALTQNLGATNMYRAGSFKCKVPHTMLMFALKLLYILGWTYLLNLVCRDGHASLAWAMVLLPWVSLLAVGGIISMNQ